MEVAMLYVTFSIEGKKDAPDFEGGILSVLSKKETDKIFSLLEKGDYIRDCKKRDLNSFGFFQQGIWKKIKGNQEESN